jgi:hypothetical protein
VTDIIETMRGLRNQTITFEATMSSLICSIGDIERLDILTSEQMERLWKATARLGNAVATKSENGESQ